MKTEINEVIHFYLGCEMMGISGVKYILQPSHLPSNWRSVENPVSGKPILRPLSSMTEEEQVEYTELINNIPVNFPDNAEGITMVDAIGTAWLLKKGFDLFGLIESSQALDLTTI
jgi:hypothetical protein